ncbi:rhomboid family intramembrane serine protease [Halobacteriales archaeon Cl-PHB]
MTSPKLRDRTAVATAARAIRSFGPRHIPATYAFLGFITAVYLGQLILAGSTADGAAKTAVYMLPGEGFLALNPWLHSDHMHILENALAFAMLGWWTERQVGTWLFVKSAVAAGYITNLLPLLAGIAGHSVGISGITNTLWTFVMLAFFTRFYPAITDPDTPDLPLIGYLILSIAILRLFVGPSIAEFIGYVPAPDGVAKEAHFLGVVLGTFWFLYRRADLDGRNPLTAQTS